MSTKYLEFNSLYRNRNIWPLASEFEIPIAQSGRNNEIDATDPVSESMPIFAWTSNNLVVGGSSQTLGAPTIVDNTFPIQYSTDSTVFVISTTLKLQQLKNYYRGLIVADTTNIKNVYRRIADYKYLGSYISGGNTYYRAQIITFNPFNDNFIPGNTLLINDPTDFSDPNIPIIWVPSGPIQDNAFNGCILYNETINQYRPILSYQTITNMLMLDTSGSLISTNYSGPIIVGGAGNWNTTDNFSIRKQPPVFYPILGNPVNLLSVVSSTSNTIIVNCLAGLSQVKDYYKNYFLRIQPYSGGVSIYDWNPIPSNNKGYRIISSYRIPEDTSLPCTGIGFKLYPSLYSIPAVNTPLEILPFSYDSFNPFVYTGSLVSQQEMVCYEVRLSHITMPNYTLVTGNGGRASNYPYMYVVLSNVSSTGGRLKNILYSNNPNAVNVIFRVQIYDVQSTLSTPFVRISGDSVPQVIKFKPNDNLYFRLTLPNGDLFQTILVENFSPSAPNFLAQISALFSFKRVD